MSAAETQTANAYGALKATQILFAKGRAGEKAKLHVRVTVVSPGAACFEGGVWHQVEQSMPELFRITMARNATGRMATPLEIANAAFCAWPSDRVQWALPALSSAQRFRGSAMQRHADMRMMVLGFCTWFRSAHRQLLSFALRRPTHPEVDHERSSKRSEGCHAKDRSQGAAAVARSYAAV